MDTTWSEALIPRGLWNLCAQVLPPFSDVMGALFTESLGSTCSQPSRWVELCRLSGHTLLCFVSERPGLTFGHLSPARVSLNAVSYRLCVGSLQSSCLLEQGSLLPLP